MTSNSELSEQMQTIYLCFACCDVYRFEGNKVKEWRVYADMSPWLSGAK